MNKNIDHTDSAKNMNTERGNGGETHQRANGDPARRCHFG